MREAAALTQAAWTFSNKNTVRVTLSSVKQNINGSYGLESQL